MAKTKRHYAAAFLMLVAVVIYGALFAMATTDSFDVPADVASGTMPPCVNFHGNATNSEALSVTLPFQPGYLHFHPNYTVTGDGAQAVATYEWFYGYPANSAWVHVNSTTSGAEPKVHTTGSTVWTVGTSSVSIPTGMIVNMGSYLGRACR